MPRTAPTLFRCVRLTLAIAACAAALWACTGHPLQAPDPEPEIQTDLPFQVSPDNKLDLIFLVDNSRSMAQEQASLARNFPLFMQELESRGKVDLHLAVISSDVGAGGINDDNCRETGHSGIFRTGNNCGLSDGATFLTIDKEGNKNFTGDLADVFGCVATLGTGGCGYEHQLQSLRTALYRPEQRNFLRPDAHLGIVLITDEDDCSGEPDATLYTGDRPGEAPNLRCATAGHVCGGMDVPAAAFTAPLASCKPFEHPGDAASKKQRLINVVRGGGPDQGAEGGQRPAADRLGHHGLGRSARRQLPDRVRLRRLRSRPDLRRAQRRALVDARRPPEELRRRLRRRWAAGTACANRIWPRPSGRSARRSSRASATASACPRSPATPTPAARACSPSATSSPRSPAAPGTAAPEAGGPVLRGRPRPLLGDDRQRRLPGPLPARLRSRPERRPATVATASCSTCTGPDDPRCAR